MMDSSDESDAESFDYSKLFLNFFFLLFFFTLISVCLPACLLACLSDACLPICLSVCLTPGMIKNSERYSFFTVVWSSGEGWLLTVTGLTGPDEQPVDLMTLSLCCKSRHDLTTAQPGTGRVTWSSGPRQKMPLHPRDTTTNTWISLC